MEDNTLYFKLQSDEKHFKFNAHQILDQIYDQRQDWIIKHKYKKPKYIKINKTIYDFLYEQLVINSKVKLWVNGEFENNAKTILGMIIKEVD